MSFGEGLQQFFKANRDNPALHIVSGQVSGDGSPSLPEAEPKTYPAKVVEGATLDQRTLAPLPASGFTHFLDGIQNSRLVCYWEGVPVLRAYAAGCVRRRSEGRVMTTLLREVREMLVFPFDMIAPATFRDFGIPLHDGPVPEKVAPENRNHPAVVCQAEHDALDRAREEIESELTAKWSAMAGPGEWLLVDGSLSGFHKRGTHERVVGVIKSHQTRYFVGEEFRRVMMLPVEHRTSAFEPQRGSRAPVYSWYLRLRQSVGGDLTFGLIRVEAAPLPSSIDAADELSAWILAERTPVSLPDGRWDRMIYPIRDCEQYLRSIVPSKVDMEARMMI